MAVDYGTNFNGNLRRPKTGVLDHGLGDNPVIIGHISHGLMGKVWGYGLEVEPITDWVKANGVKVAMVSREIYPSGPSAYWGVSQKDAERMKSTAPAEVLACAGLS